MEDPARGTPLPPLSVAGFDGASGHGCYCHKEMIATHGPKKKLSRTFSPSRVCRRKRSSPHAVTAAVRDAEHSSQIPDPWDLRGDRRVLIRAARFVSVCHAAGDK